MDSKSDFIASAKADPSGPVSGPAGAYTYFSVLVNRFHRRKRTTRAAALTLTNEEVCAHQQAQRNHQIAHLLGIGPLGKMGPKPAATQRAGNHHPKLRPQYGPGHDKGNDRGGVNRGCEQGADSADRQNIAHAQRGQHSENDEPDARPKVSAVYREDQFDGRTCRNGFPGHAAEVIGSASVAGNGAYLVAEGK